MADLFLLFNHSLTDRQAAQARQELGVAEIHEPPLDISRLWANIPSEPESISDFLAPVYVWIDNNTTAGDFILIQGDFGACYLVVQYVNGRGVTPVYSTTERRAVEKQLHDGRVQLTHTFQYVRFRKYGK